MQNPNLPSNNQFNFQANYPPNQNQNNMYQAPDPQGFQSVPQPGSIPIYNYNQDQPLNTLPLENRPVVIVEDRTNKVPNNGGQRFGRMNQVGQPLNEQCRNCKQVGFVYLQPTIDPCYCCFVIIMSIICILFVFLLCCPCGIKNEHICINCGHKWKVE